ncbi:HNH endonuclease [Cyanobacteria bacterium FACHB-502]|nr:HNH endonuclease [Cyanobacteria bacterium FACHB-502]MBD2023863.1 HNH endonuclease [Leptolyngbya sp. FACHB-711]
MRCELCDRAVPALTAHHLTPRQNTKRKKLDSGPTIQICSACHRQIHAFYNNAHLAKELNSLEKLQQDPKMQNFIAWVKKQYPGKRVQVDRR